LYLYDADTKIILSRGKT